MTIPRHCSPQHALNTLSQTQIAAEKEPTGRATKARRRNITNPYCDGVINCWGIEHERKKKKELTNDQALSTQRTAKSGVAFKWGREKKKNGCHKKERLF